MDCSTLSNELTQEDIDMMCESNDIMELLRLVTKISRAMKLLEKQQETYDFLSKCAQHQLDICFYDTLKSKRRIYKEQPCFLHTQTLKATDNYNKFVGRHRMYTDMLCVLRFRIDKIRVCCGK